MYPTRKKEPISPSHVTQVETEAQRRFIVAEPGLYQAPSSRTWLLPRMLSVRASAGAIPAMAWHSVVHSGHQEVRGFVGNDGFPESLVGETSVGNLRETVRRMLLMALSA